MQAIKYKRDNILQLAKAAKKSKGNGSNSCSVNKAEHINHVWTYDFMQDSSEGGRTLKLLTVLDEWMRELVRLKRVAGLVLSALCKI